MARPRHQGLSSGFVGTGCRTIIRRFVWLRARDGEGIRQAGPMECHRTLNRGRTDRGRRALEWPGPKLDLYFNTGAENAALDADFDRVMSRSLAARGVARAPVARPGANRGRAQPCCPAVPERNQRPGAAVPCSSVDSAGYGLAIWIPRWFPGIRTKHSLRKSGTWIKMFKCRFFLALQYLT